MVNDTGRTGKRANRVSHYGNPVEKGVVEMTTSKNRKARKSLVRQVPVSSKPKVTYSPVSDEVTPYGAKKYRTPVYKDEFTGTRGSLIDAVILDIDGTLSDWGSGLSKEIEDWLKKHYKAGRVFIVITARDHGTFGYESSFNWLVRHLPYPFIGPFARPKDDPRYASEFKRELAEDLSRVFNIVGAADDNEWVIKMWKQWAIDKFEDPEDFDLFEASYGHYGDWRGGLGGYKGFGYSDNDSWYGSPSSGGYGKGYGQGTYGSQSTVSKGVPEGAKWVNGHLDPVTKKWIDGHYEDVKPEAKHRPAGTSHWTSSAAERDLTKVVGWQDYLAKREKKGAYLGVERQEDDLEELREAVREDAPLLSDIEIAALSVEELRQIVDEIAQEKEDEEENQTREFLLANVDDWFQGSFSNDDLDLLDNDELGELLNMTDAAATDFVNEKWAALDAAWDEREGAEEQGDEAQVETQLSHKARTDLENEVYARYPDLTIETIEGRSDYELNTLLRASISLEQRKEALAKSVTPSKWDPDATGPLDVAEVLTEDPERTPVPVSQFVDVQLPPLGEEAAS